MANYRDDTEFLRTLGERVRTARARRGMTRRQLAGDSGVSERYLAQLEGGQGNISIGRLRQVVDALSLKLVDLLREGSEAPPELALMQERLARLDGAGLARVEALLNEVLAHEAGDERGGRIALVGLRGAGKSTLGRGLSERLAVPFIELVAETEAEAGMSADEIFALSGQAAYRRHERRALEQVIARHDQAVIASGGGLVSEASTFERLLASCTTIWLKARPEDHMSRVVAQGDQRPMAGNAEAMADLRRILDGREALYRQAASVVDTSGRNVADCLDELEALARAALD
ncbi:MAG: helix-turn-helix transcriptional regulator [Alphaproteobacteria bacterium]|nr:helix-turn-helix transcriptional regulator [Alphaproteobacteria bacterium]HJP22730.1 helix-turn-helix transcriptional regulator [Alphaproteobacteria bacterium]